MGSLRIGIQLASLRLPIKKALHTAARLGAEAVEIDARGELRPDQFTWTGARQLRKMLDDLNLRVAAVGFHTRRGYNVPEQLEARMAATKQAMHMAYRLGAPVVVNHVGRVPDQSEGPEWDLLVDVLQDLGRYGQHVGALLAAETGAEPPERLAALIQALPAGALAVTLDPGNLVIQGYSPTDAVRLLGPHILHVHAKDAVRDAAQGRGLETPLGRGSVDFAELIGLLDQLGYQGYYTIERQGADDPVEQVGQAVQYLKNLAA